MLTVMSISRPPTFEMYSGFHTGYFVTGGWGGGGRGRHLDDLLKHSHIGGVTSEIQKSVLTN